MQTGSRVKFRLAAFAWVFVLWTCPVSAEEGWFQGRIETDKFVYEPGETAKIRVLISPTAAPGRPAEIKGRLSFKVGEGTTCREIESREIVLAVGKEEAFSFEVPLGQGEGGCSFLAGVTPSSASTAARQAIAEYSLITRNPLAYSHEADFAGYCMADSWSWSPEAKANYCRSSILGSRYFGVLELFCWAPDDFASLAPEEDQWRSGQTYAAMDKRMIQVAIEEAHKQGQWFVSYANTYVFGPHGFAHALEHPDWYYWDSNWYGSVYDTRVLRDNWQLEEALRAKEGPQGWGQTYPHSWVPGLHSITPLVVKPEVRAFHNDQIKKSIAMFHWDGIRYDNDGWRVLTDLGIDSFGNRLYPPNADGQALQAKYIAEQRAEMKKIVPHWVYGNNGAGFSPGTIKPFDLAKAPKGWLAEATEGGMVMEEGFNSWMHTGKWEDIRGFMHLGAKGVRAAGGFPYLIGPQFCNGQDSHADVRIVNACALASGVHFVCGSGGGGMHPGTRDIVQFSVRWADCLFDPTLKWIAQPEDLVEVEAPLWWKEYIRVRKTVSGRNQLIVHLINPPEHETFNTKKDKDKADPKDGPRAPVQDSDKGWALPPLIHKDIPVTVDLRGAKLTQVLWATPDGGDFEPKVLSPKTEGSQLHVTIPTLDYWTMLMVETEGK